MSTETLTRFRCDAPHCQTNGIGSNNITPPDEWTVLKSTAHIPVTKDFLAPARRRSRALTYSERCYGGFSLHLCPAHPDAFNAHRPITNGHGYKSNVAVSCSCGMNLGIAAAATMVARYPSHAPESAWFRHLPAELRWYLWRGERQWATQTTNHGITSTQQYASEERARDRVDVGASMYGAPVLVYRDAEGDEWTKVGL